VIPRPIPLLDLHAQWKLIRSEVMHEIERVADSQHFILGEDVAALEQTLASYCSVPYAVGCASGSDALTLALMALGIGGGDAVLTAPYTFFATAGSICECGARPVFVDVDPVTFNMDPAQMEAAFRAHPDIRAIIPVHLFGASADMDPICAVAAKHGVPVIEDAAQAIGAEYKGRRAGSLGAIGCFSFFPSKNLGAFGDGGMLTTSDALLDRSLRSLRVHGSETRYVHERVGVNSRLDTLQAAVLRVKMKRLDEWTASRRRNAARYREALGQSGAPVTLPQEQSYQTRCVYNQFVILGPRRDELKEHLADAGVGTAIYYPIPLHLQQCFAGLGYHEGDFPVSERLAKESLALPIYPELEHSDIHRVSDSIVQFYRQ